MKTPLFCFVLLPAIICMLTNSRSSLADATREGVPESLKIENASLSVDFNTSNAAFSVTDRRTGQIWSQKRVAPEMAVTGARIRNGALEADLTHTPTGLRIGASARLDGKLPELTVALSGDGNLPSRLAFPFPFESRKGMCLVVPMNEGISYPVEDETIGPMRLVAYGGHGICMAFWGVTDGEKGHMAVIETPDDAAVRIMRVGGNLTVSPEWDAQKGRFGYERKLRYIFFDRGGHVAMCKRYRSHAKSAGLLKTLAQKRASNPDVDLLAGAVNVWCWDNAPLAIAADMRAAGIERILWSNRGKPDQIEAMNKQGILTSRYDIYQDVMDPANFAQLRWVHSDWPTAAWPKDLMTDASGNRIKGWQVETRDGRMVPCGVLCDRQAMRYARERIAEDLKTRAYKCRFIDTTTASPWRECWNPEHPVTRSESRKFKMELLKIVCEEFKLVTGSETGHDAAVPYVHYFEGMLSLGNYRVPDSGRNMIRIVDDVPDRVAKFQVGHQYRLPLWELVYHDCVIAQWYWGDYNNKLPSLWDKRDLFNVLYGTPPMFMFTKEYWEKNKDRFAQSYRNTCPVARAVAYSEMTDHKFLTPDRSVQQTVFANGVTVTVNFGPSPYKAPDGSEVGPGSFRAVGMGMRLADLQP